MIKWIFVSFGYKFYCQCNRQIESYLKEYCWELQFFDSPPQYLGYSMKLAAGYFSQLIEESDCCLEVQWNYLQKPCLKRGLRIRMGFLLYILMELIIRVSSIVQKNIPFHSHWSIQKSSFASGTIQLKFNHLN